MVQSESTTWFDEIDLDPTGSWLRMGTRQLGDRPWLVFDEHRDGELALKRQLGRRRPREVFDAQPDATGPGQEVLELVAAELKPRGLSPATDRDRGADGGAWHPLQRAGLSVQEDLCLMRRDADGWVLAAASLSFPSRWRLAEKMGRPLVEVHQPVEGYRPQLASRVDSLFDRLGSRIVWRRNWFVHPDDALYQPDRPADGDPVIAPQDCSRTLVLRSERQTLRTLPSGWILFTIRIQQAGLGTLWQQSERRAAFAHLLDAASAEHLDHRGMSGPQVESLRVAMTQHR